MVLLKLFLLICFFTVKVYGITCYSCFTTSENFDESCVNDPDLVPSPTIDCNKKYCTSTRVEYADSTKKIVSMHRGCEDNPILINQVVEDANFRSYFKACLSDKCNGGSGKDFQSGVGLVGDIGEAIVLVVPGIGMKANGSRNILSLVVVFGALLIGLLK